MMPQTTRSRRPAVELTLGLGLGLGLALALAAEVPAAAQPEQFSASVRIEQESNPPMEMTYWIAPGRFRMDMPELSVVWSQSRMLMIQHAERRYMEWGERQMQMMQQMMGRMGGGGVAPPDQIDPDVTFTATGHRETIGAWDAFEVQVQNADGDQGRLWLSEDVEVGLFELLASVVQLASTMQMQMPLSMAGQPQNPQAAIARYAAIARAEGMPAGRVVRLVSTGADLAERGTSTLLGVQVAPAPAGTFDPPEGYEAMRMPAMPGRR